MKKRYWLSFFLGLVFFLLQFGSVLSADSGKKSNVVSMQASRDNNVVRTCVIGGAIMTGLWDRISEKFEARTGYKVKIVSTGPRPKISKSFQRGEADLLTMHSGDITTDLVVEGYGINMRPWARNDLILLGPPSDPAGIKGMKDGAKAFQRIAETKSPYLDAYGIRKRELAQKMWKKAKIKPTGSWILRDDSSQTRKMLRYASDHKAYVIFGRMPIVYKKVNYGDLEIMVEGDLSMRRPYIVMEANPKVFPNTNREGARALSDFLLSPEIQNFMKNYGKKKNNGYPKPCCVTACNQMISVPNAMWICKGMHSP